MGSICSRVKKDSTYSIWDLKGELLVQYVPREKANLPCGGGGGGGGGIVM